MEYIVDSNEMKEIDDYTMKEIGIPSLVLMERAATSVVDIMKDIIKKEDRILVVCGPGNNGADGVAAGRILYIQGFKVAIFLPFERDKCSAEMKVQLNIATNLGISINNSININEYNIIIDGIFGIGLSKPITENLSDIINEINQADNKVFSVDIHSGISTDTGKVLNVAIKADYTITFGYMKPGLVLYPGADYAGNIVLADIGFPKKALQYVNPSTFYYTKNDLDKLPQRKNYGHKGTFGKVLVIAGGVGMSGAAYLSAKAAYKIGAGMVKVLTSSKNREIIQTLLPEALFASCDTEEDILTNIIWADTIVIGPGLGVTNSTDKLLSLVINQEKVPVIIDADAINLLASQLDGLQGTVEDRISKLQKILPKHTILTPHPLELSRLLGEALSDLSDNIIDIANQCSYNNELVYVMKDARTLVAYSNQIYLNTSGNNGMATAGSGDVLTGVIAGLIAQGMSSYEAACLGVYIHGLAGDRARDNIGAYSVMAGDIVDAIEMVLPKKS